jgi:hypothetical protein
MGVVADSTNPTSFGNTSNAAITPAMTPPGPASGTAKAGAAGASAQGQVPTATTPPPAGGSAAMNAPQPGSNGFGAAGSSAESSCEMLRVPVQLAVQLVIDESASMLYPNDLWAPLGGALGNFFASDQAARMQLGVEFFQGACDSATYASPALPIGPAAGQQAALDAAMTARTHGPGAATAAALSGALDQARQWNAAHGDAQIALMLISGSEPTGCFGSLDTAAGVAASGLTGTPAVPTYVVALRELASLDRIAQAGGSDQALVVAQPTAQQALLDAMQAAATRARCQYALPASAAPYLPDNVNLRLSEGAISTNVPRVADAGACDANAGGWYYDDPSQPTRILTCDATCKRVAQGGSVELIFGCSTTKAP